MTPTEIANIAVLTATVGFGWAIIAYSGYANLRGWTVGSWFAGDFSWLQGLAYLALVGGVALSTIVGAWWHAIVVLLGAFILVRILFSFFGPRSQVVALVGTIVGLALSAMLVWQ